mgnify:CR=1 FL=1
MFVKKIKNYTFVAPSKYKYKKYDVYKDGHYIVSFGDARYQHYKDIIGAYDFLDHNDPIRRKLFKQRHSQRLNDLESATWFSDKFLW